MIMASQDEHYKSTNSDKVLLPSKKPCPDCGGVLEYFIQASSAANLLLTLEGSLGLEIIEHRCIDCDFTTSAHPDWPLVYVGEVTE